MKTFIVSEEVLLGIRKYLGTRPFDEVAPGVIAIENIFSEQKTESPETNPPDVVV